VSAILRKQKPAYPEREKGFVPKRTKEVRHRKKFVALKESIGARAQGVLPARRNARTKGERRLGSRSQGRGPLWNIGGGTCSSFGEGQETQCEKKRQERELRGLSNHVVRGGPLLK